jgi:RHS repeat-associated protein
VVDAQGTERYRREQPLGHAAATTWEELAIGLTSPVDGSLEVWVENANIEPAYVWFDDLTVERGDVPTALVVQEAHYDPWGLELAPLGYNAPQNAEDRFKFNGGSERETGLGLHWDETPLRPYDAQLGRFHGIDLLAEMFPGITPMHFGYNNPVMFNDPSGLLSDLPDAYAYEKERDKRRRAFDRIAAANPPPCYPEASSAAGPGESSGPARMICPPPARSGCFDDGGNWPPSLGIDFPTGPLDRLANTLLAKEYLNHAHDFYRENIGTGQMLVRYRYESGVIFIMEGATKDDDYKLYTFTNTSAAAVAESGIQFYNDIVAEELGVFQNGGEGGNENLAGAKFPSGKYPTAFMLAYPAFKRFLGTGLLHVHHRIPQHYRYLFGDDAIDNLSNLVGLSKRMHLKLVTPIWEIFRRGNRNPTQKDVIRFAKVMDRIIGIHANNIDSIIKQKL